jgi:hypothetical protein
VSTTDEKSIAFEKALREMIAKQIEEITPNHWWGNLKFPKTVITEAASIARGKVIEKELK